MLRLNCAQFSPLSSTLTISVCEAELRVEQKSEIVSFRIVLMYVVAVYSSGRNYVIHSCSVICSRSGNHLFVYVSAKMVIEWRISAIIKNQVNHPDQCRDWIVLIYVWVNIDKDNDRKKAEEFSKDLFLGKVRTNSENILYIT
jgi:hypothetical protein